jgi:phosphohistidine phosphatase
LAFGSAGNSSGDPPPFAEDLSTLYLQENRMLIYLLRHAIAEPRGSAEYPNDDRPLTEAGIRKMTQEAKNLSRIIPPFDVILASPLSRAVETANIVAGALPAETSVQICRELLPGSSIKKLMAYLAKYKNLSNILLVGHEPDLGRLASNLLGSPVSILELKKGSIACIEVDCLPPSTAGRLLWLLTPGHVRALG